MLYKYRSLLSKTDHDHAQRMIEGGECFLSSVGSLNDPFDCWAIFEWGLEGTEEIAYFEKMMTEQGVIDPGERAAKIQVLKAGRSNQRIREEVLGEVVSGLGVLSMSRSCESVAMWSHYADGHRGICVGFDEEVMQNELMVSHFTMQNVAYSDKLPIVQIENLSAGAIQLITTKSKEWEYEQETRVVALARHSHADRILRTDSCREVILGCEISDENLKLVEEWCGAAKGRISIRQSVKSKTDFRVSVPRATALAKKRERHRAKRRRR